MLCCIINQLYKYSEEKTANSIKNVYLKGVEDGEDYFKLSREDGNLFLIQLIDFIDKYRKSEEIIEEYNNNFSKSDKYNEKFDQIGCIHTSQGLEFDYVGVIIGKDLRYEYKNVVTDYRFRAKTDTSLKGIKKSKNYKLADQIIRNTYRTLLSRGQKGCYIYCEDKKLSEYIKKIISNRF